MSSHLTNHWRDRLKASGLHLGVSMVFAILAATLVLGLWYPYPYREISGGQNLLFIVMAVDVILGPLITLVVFNRAKPRQELRRDLALVVLIQLFALGYGFWTVFVARPVHLVFEYDRFRVAHAIDIPSELLSMAPPSIQAFPVFGPTLLSLRPFRNKGEEMDATLAALQGLPLAARPDLWQPYAAGIPDILKAAKPVSELKSRFPGRAKEVDVSLATVGHTVASTVYLPLVGRQSYWTVLLDFKTAEIVAYVPIDSF